MAVDLLLDILLLALLALLQTALPQHSTVVRLGKLPQLLVLGAATLVGMDVQLLLLLELLYLPQLLRLKLLFEHNPELAMGSQTRVAAIVVEERLLEEGPDNTVVLYCHTDDQLQRRLADEGELRQPKDNNKEVLLRKEEPSLAEGGQGQGPHRPVSPVPRRHHRI